MLRKKVPWRSFGREFLGGRKKRWYCQPARTVALDYRLFIYRTNTITLAGLVLG